MASVGAPSKYDPSYCERVIELGKTGASKAKMASMLGVHRDSLHEWARVHPEFSDALSRATQEAQVWWEDVGQSNLTNKSFQAGAWGKNMSCRFKDDWTENSKQQIEHTGPDGKPLGIAVSFVDVESSTVPEKT